MPSYGINCELDRRTDGYRLPDGTPCDEKAPGASECCAWCGRRVPARLRGTLTCTDRCARVLAEANEESFQAALRSVASAECDLGDHDDGFLAELRRGMRYVDDLADWWTGTTEQADAPRHRLEFENRSGSSLDCVPLYRKNQGGTSGTPSGTG